MFYGWLVAVAYMTSLPDEPGADGRSVATFGGFLFLLVWRGLGTAVRLIVAATPASPAPVRASAIALATRAHQKFTPLMCRQHPTGSSEALRGISYPAGVPRGIS